MDTSYFDDIIGHKKNLSHLISDITNGNISHAYLFYGASGIGKFTVAKAFASILQDQIYHKAQDNFIIDEIPNESQDEQTLTTNLDLKPRKSDSISIEDINILISILNKSTFSKFKIVLIKKIERMTKSASNALLKTLEETPSNQTIFLLTSDNLTHLPKTLVSRCRLMYFPKVRKEETEAGVKALGYDAKSIDTLIEITPHDPGKIITLLKNPETLGLHLQILDSIKRLLSVKDNLVERFNFVSEISSSQLKTNILLDNLNYYLYKKFNNEIKSKDNAKELNKKMEILITAKEYLRKNVNTKLVLENIFLVF